MANVKFKKSQSRMWESNSTKKKKKKSHLNSFHSSPNSKCLPLFHCFFTIIDEEKKTDDQWGSFKELWKNSLLNRVKFGMCYIVLHTFYPCGVKDPSISEVIHFVPEIHCGSQCKTILPFILSLCVGMAFLLDCESSEDFLSHEFPIQSYDCLPVEKHEDKTIRIPNG